MVEGGGGYSGWFHIVDSPIGGFASTRVRIDRHFTRCCFPEASLGWKPLDGECQHPSKGRRGRGTKGIRASFTTHSWNNAGQLIC